MIYREAEKELQLLSAQFKAVAVTGPRQSGKTTLVKNVFKEKAYVNLENPDLRQFAREDPRGFLSNYPDGAILDEVQRVPELFSYLQQILDEKEQNGSFILTGSNNFLLNSNISQSLAGRVGYLFLLPLDIGEINPGANMSNQLIFKGGYPEIYQKDIDPKKYYDNYIRTYVERDVRLLKNITDLYTFERFLRLCAGRTGQLLNMSSLAADVGVDVKTIGSWLGVLEASFIAFRLYPYHENYNKRIVKMPKLYFYDTGLASALMGIEDVSQLNIHPLRGGLFENLVVVDFLKRLYNNGKQNNLYFWRDNIGNEVDLLIKKGANRYPVEIKSAQTISDEFFKGIRYWNKLTNTEGGYLVYAGDMLQKRSGEINIVPIHLLNTIEI
ncbi:AAA family ATPase [Dysgonamonadaceae bacterium]|jgi:predicted AAA+ superfamily ATPase|nr:AAA family ATPase [Dysgonamonadaceae bacterium]